MHQSPGGRAGPARQQSWRPGRGGTSGAYDGVGQPGATHGGLAGVLVVQRAPRVELHYGDVRLARRRVIADARVALHAAAAARRCRSVPEQTPPTRGPMCVPEYHAHAHADIMILTAWAVA